MGVESEVREALTNLIFNAVDAMPDGGTLTLRTRSTAPLPHGRDAAARYALVEVVDTGVGMDEETRRRCLEPFFTTKGERGTGLGLAMVYGIVQRHGADVEIDSAIGRGTTVRLRFPVPAIAPASVGPIGAAGMPATRLRILIVDDDPLMLKSLRDTLEVDGHFVVTANGGQAGIDAFRAARRPDETFDVVITDLGMPYVDGRKVASAVKDGRAGHPVDPAHRLGAAPGRRWRSADACGPCVEQAAQAARGACGARATDASVASGCRRGAVNKGAAMTQAARRAAAHRRRRSGADAGLVRHACRTTTSKRSAAPAARRRWPSCAGRRSTCCWPT